MELWWSYPILPLKFNSECVEGIANLYQYDGSLDVVVMAHITFLAKFVGGVVAGRIEAVILMKIM